MAPLISLIMPVYNTEKYLKEAVDSVLAQTFQDFELIMADDCSTDGSAATADRYAEDHPGKIRVIHLEKNGGPSNARNRALEIACGRYVGFMDSDDTIEKDMLERAASCITEHAPDAVIFGMTERYYAQDGSLKYTKKIVMPCNGLLDREGLRRSMIQLEERTLYGYTCNKFYRLDRIKKCGIKYEKLRLLEDTVFNIEYFNDAENAYIVSYAPYNYARRIENSVTSQFVPEYYELHTMKVRRIYGQYEYWNMCTPEVKRILGNIYVRYTLSALQRNCDRRAAMKHKDRKAFLKEQYGSVLYADLAESCRPGNRLIGIFAALYRKKLTGLSLMYARAVYIAKNRLPVLFARFKQNG